jgi:hypothetical protein
VQNLKVRVSSEISFLSGAELLCVVWLRLRCCAAIRSEITDWFGLWVVTTQEGIGRPRRIKPKRDVNGLEGRLKPSILGAC